MSKMAVCDVCDRREPLERSYSTVPEAWFTIRQSFKDEQHLCSLPCLERKVAQMRADADTAATVTAALATTAASSMTPQ